MIRKIIINNCCLSLCEFCLNGVVRSSIRPIMHGAAVKLSYLLVLAERLIFNNSSSSSSSSSSIRGSDPIKSSLRTQGNHAKNGGISHREEGILSREDDFLVLSRKSVKIKVPIPFLLQIFLFNATRQLAPSLMASTYC